MATRIKANDKTVGQEEMEARIKKGSSVLEYMLHRLYYSLSQPLMPLFRTNITTMLRYAGEDMNAEEWLGQTIAIGVFVFLTAGITLYFLEVSTMSIILILGVCFTMLVT